MYIPTHLPTQQPASKPTQTSAAANRIPDTGAITATRCDDSSVRGTAAAAPGEMPLLPDTQPYAADVASLLCDASAAVAMAPCNACCVLGLPVAGMKPCKGSCPCKGPCPCEASVGADTTLCSGSLPCEASSVADVTLCSGSWLCRSFNVHDMAFCCGFCPCASPSMADMALMIAVVAPSVL